MYKVYKYVYMWLHQYHRDKEHFHHPQVSRVTFLFFSSCPPHLQATTYLLDITTQKSAVSRTLYKWIIYYVFGDSGFFTQCDYFDIYTHTNNPLSYWPIAYSFRDVYSHLPIVLLLDIWNVSPLGYYKREALWTLIYKSLSVIWIHFFP